MRQTGPVSPDPERPQQSERQRRFRLVWTTLVGLVVAGVLVGLVLSWVGSRVVDAAGLDEVQPVDSTATEAVGTPPNGEAPAPTGGDPGQGSGQGSGQGPGEGTSTPSGSTTDGGPTGAGPGHDPASGGNGGGPKGGGSDGGGLHNGGGPNGGGNDAPAGRLAASSASARAYERVRLTGTLPRTAAGRTLQVERLEGGAWVPFPTTATTDASGSFTTYVELGQPGANVLRLSLPGSDRSTPPVTVTIG